MSVYKPSDLELDSFCDGMYEMYNFSSSFNPDLVIFPLRGAYPFSVAYKKISELREEETPYFLFLPIGNFIDDNIGRERGLTKPEKIEVINSSLQEYFDNNPNSKNILLIDEVMIGGTILTHHRLISKYFAKNGIKVNFNVCAIEHGKYIQRTKYRNKVKEHGFCTVRVESLFVMDREQYLPVVRKNGSFSFEFEEGKLELILRRLENMY